MSEYNHGDVFMKDEIEIVEGFIRRYDRTHQYGIDSECWNKFKEAAATLIEAKKRPIKTMSEKIEARRKIHIDKGQFYECATKLALN